MMNYTLDWSKKKKTLKESKRQKEKEDRADVSNSVGAFILSNMVKVVH